MTAATVVLRTAPRADDAAGRLGSAARWALASRLARRDVRRRPGRTLLVTLLVAVPVFAMAVASVAYRTNRDSVNERYTRQHGASDVAIDGITGSKSADSPDTPTTESLLAALPPGSRMVDIRTLYWAPIRPEGAVGSVRVRVTDLPIDDPMTRGMVDVTSGRAPAATGEVLLSGSAASRFGVGLGDTLRLDSPAGAFHVVGIGRLADAFREPVMVVHPSVFATVRPDTVVHTWLATVPGGLTADTLTSLSDMSHTTPVARGSAFQYQGESTPHVQTLAWGWVVGALMLTVMGIIISAAFATSARRQLVTLGQLSANGADQRLLRRTLVLQGAWSGALGSTFGLVGAAVALFLGRGVIEDVVVRHSMGPYVVSGLDMAVIFLTGAVAASIAAFVPARTITKVPVLSALGGRRPLGAVPRRLVPTGLAMFGGGVVLLVVVASASRTSSSDANLYAAVAVVGGLGVLFGMCCLTPATVAVLGPVAERQRGVGRLAARSLARSRTRSAAVVTAVAAAGALSVGGATLVSAAWHQSDEVPWIGKNLVWADAQTYLAQPAVPEPGLILVDDPAPGLLPVPADVRTGLAAILPGAAAVTLRYAVYDPAPYDPTPYDPIPAFNRLLVADPAVADLLGLSAADRQALEAGALLVPEGVQPPGAAPTQGVLRLGSGPITVDLVSATASPRVRALWGSLLVSAAVADRLGLAIGESGVIYVAGHDLTRSEREAVADLADLQNAAQGNPFEPAPPVSADQHYVSLQYWGGGSWRVPKALVDALIVAGALLFTLGVVGIGLALSAAESRDERDVLLAVGARPRSMRRLSAAKATLLAGLGGVLAVPTGFLPVAVVLAKLNHPAEHLRFPWLVVAGVVFVVPVMVGLVAWFGSTISQRVRPVRMSTLAMD